MCKKQFNYGTAILDAFEYLLDNYPEVFVIGQGLWSPWYVGNTMTNLDKKYGKHRIIDTPVSESAVTGAGVGASLCGMRPIVVHPRMDFMLYAMDPIVNQAAKWSYMFGGQSNPSVTIRAIINRGGEQGAQHSQALHAWFAHVPGLRVVMPSSVEDARDLLIASVLCDDPVIYIDDRWLYDQEDELPPAKEIVLEKEGPRIVKMGQDITIVASGYATFLAKESILRLEKMGINPEIIDVRVLNPFDYGKIITSVQKTKNLVVIDPGSLSCGFSAEIISRVVENIDPGLLRTTPRRIALPDSPAPTSKNLEDEYYPNVDKIIFEIKQLIGEL